MAQKKRGKKDLKYGSEITAKFNFFSLLNFPNEHI